MEDEDLPFLVGFPELQGFADQRQYLCRGVQIHRPQDMATLILVGISAVYHL